MNDDRNGVGGKIDTEGRFLTGGMANPRVAEFVRGEQGPGEVAGHELSDVEGFRTATSIPVVVGEHNQVAAELKKGEEVWEESGC